LGLVQTEDSDFAQRIAEWEHRGENQGMQMENKTRKNKYCT